MNKELSYFAIYTKYVFSEKYQKLDLFPVLSVLQLESCCRYRLHLSSFMLIEFNYFAINNFVKFKKIVIKSRKKY